MPHKIVTLLTVILLSSVFSLPVNAINFASLFKKLSAARKAPADLFNDLLTAVIAENLDAIKRIVASKPNIVDFQDTSMHDNTTALMVAAYYGKTKSVRRLLDHDANPYLTTTGGTSAFMIAAVRGNYDSMCVLYRPLDRSHCDIRGHNAYDLATIARKNTSLSTQAQHNLDVVLSLLKHTGFKLSPDVKRR